ncbi:MAG: oligosaccharide flippase family protein [bacterium]
MNNNNSLTDRLLRNTFYNTAGKLWEIAVSLFLAPYIIHHIGIELFGIWIIILTVTYFLDFFEFSITSPIVKYISEYYSQNKTKKLYDLINTTLCSYFFVSFSCSVIGIMCSPLILKLFNVQTEFIHAALFALKLSFIIFSLTNIFLMFNSVLRGLQLMDISNKIFISNTIVRIIGVIIVLNLNFGLRGLASAMLIEILFGLTVVVWITARKLPGIYFNPFRFNISLFKMLFKFGSKLHAGKIAFLISFHFDKFLLARWVSITSVGFYELGSKICFTARRIATLAISAFLPVISEADASKDERILYELYARGLKYLAFASCAFFLFLLYNADLIFAAWLKNQYAQSAFILQILCFGYFCNSMILGITIFVIGIGKPEIEMKYNLFVTLVNILLSVTLVILCGLPGIVIGTSSALILGSIYYLHLLKKNTSFPISLIFKALKIPLIASAVSLAAIIPFNYFDFSSPVYNSRIHDLTALGIRGIVYTAVFLLTALKLGILDDKDKWVIKTLIFKRFFPILLKKNT